MGLGLLRPVLSEISRNCGAMHEPPFWADHSRTVECGRTRPLAGSLHKDGRFVYFASNVTPCCSHRSILYMTSKFACVPRSGLLTRESDTRVGDCVYACSRVAISRMHVATHAPMRILKRIEAPAACGFCGSILKLPAMPTTLRLPSCCVRVFAVR